MIKTISESEINNLLLAANKSDYRDFTMVYLALSTGLRVSELVGLFIEDVLPFGQVSTILTVPQRIGKNSKKREIPINDDLRSVLTEFIRIKKIREQPTELNSFFFVSHWSHRPLSSRDFQRIVHDLSSSSIGRSITPHILRHTFATRLLKHTNIRVIQELLGHSNLQTTEIYTHVDTSDTRQAIDNLKLPSFNI